MGLRQGDVEQVADGVFRVCGTLVNWYLVEDGRDLTLVDAGYPGDADDVETSIALSGHRPEDVRAVLVTHAHADHLGAVPRPHATYGIPAYTDPVEVRHARREYLEQVSVPTVLARGWRPGVAAWALRALRRGTRHVRATEVLPFPPAVSWTCRAARSPSPPTVTRRATPPSPCHGSASC